MKELTFVHCKPSKYSFIDKLAIHGFSLIKFHCKECVSFSAVSSCRTMNCRDLRLISFQEQFVGTLVLPYDSLEVTICDTKSEAFVSALESEGWHQVSDHGTLECKAVMDLKSWYITLNKEIAISTGNPYECRFVVVSFEDLCSQEKDERDLAELNPIAELLGKPTQLTKEENAYNEGYNAALAVLLDALEKWEPSSPDEEYLTWGRIYGKMSAAKESFQKPTNSKEV